MATGMPLDRLLKSLTRNKERPKTMRALKKLIGQIYRPYKFKAQRQELTLLLNSLVLL